MRREDTKMQRNESRLQQRIFFDLNSSNINTTDEALNSRINIKSVFIHYSTTGSPQTYEHKLYPSLTKSLCMKLNFNELALVFNHRFVLCIRSSELH